MKPRMSFPVRPFHVPNYVTLEMPEGARGDITLASPAIPINELDDETLEALCKQFRDALFAKRGKG